MSEGGLHAGPSDGSFESVTIFSMLTRKQVPGKKSSKMRKSQNGILLYTEITYM